MTLIRHATPSDLENILLIYNQGIEDRIATLETETKSLDEMRRWLENRTERYFVLVAVVDEGVAGWASVNPYNGRNAYRGVGDLSIYIDRAYRGRGIGQQLLAELEARAAKAQFHKLVLFTFPFNALGQGLYRKAGFREVGIFHNQGKLDGKFVDVMAMEKILSDQV
ncbi:phosphinothricin acetyltransferase [Tumebacillus sp. BK434]|uniref:arsinothricin resistance N-acetyltransferase ArsN1 family A n=1 Tax=Tumebacillus sp. BK434 TaxID=2512169 RepID=UPI001046F973|nr:arsinothricin resistance N-acetyltransferase ArsN1 family A [Tumebacillus sp. BK434]TCP58140.1 phosphinothricin acetyltransferase [Tumebacillus sp. BK434]